MQQRRIQSCLALVTIFRMYGCPQIVMREGVLGGEAEAGLMQGRGDHGPIWQRHFPCAEPASGHGNGKAPLTFAEGEIPPRQFFVRGTQPADQELLLASDLVAFDRFPVRIDQRGHVTDPVDDPDDLSVWIEHRLVQKGPISLMQLILPVTDAIAV